jgi:hypothetical protein
MKKEKKFEFESIPVLISQAQLGEHVETSSNLLVNSPTGILHISIDKNLVEKVRDYAYWERITKKEVVSRALEQFFLDKNTKNKPDTSRVATTL